MEKMTLHLLADARTAQVADADLQAINGLTSFYKEVPVEIALFLYDLAGQPYPEETLKSRTWAFIIADDFNEDTLPQLRASAVEAVGANELKITLPEMNTVELAAVLGTEKSVRLGAELYGKLNGDTADNWVMQFNCQVRNRRESTGIPVEVEINFYTKKEIDSLLAEKADKSYVDGRLGDIDTILDAINGEVI